MYRLLIVDDESYIVESLSELFLAQQDMNLDVLTADYGEKALEILASQKVDVILLDIKMPGISGIEVAKKILVDWPQCRIIFLTGYASFDYIYEINQMPNTSFLLKTEDSSTIIAAVGNAISEIEEQKNYQQLASQMKQIQIRMEYLLHADIFRDLLSGKKIAELQETLCQKEISFPFDTSSCLYLLYLKIRWKSVANFQGDFHQRIAELTCYLHQQLNEKYLLSLTDVDSETFAVFLQPHYSMPDGMHRNHCTYIRECLNDCISSYQSIPGCQLLLLIRGESIDWDQIESVFSFYHQYYLQVVLPSFPQYGHIITCAEEELKLSCNGNYPYDMAISKKMMSQLTAGLQSGSEQQVNLALDWFGQIFREIGSMHHLTAINLYHQISNLYIEFIIQYGLMEKLALQIGLYKLYSYNQFQSWKELIDYYKKLSAILLQTITFEENGSRERTISQIKAYIQNNLNRELSLTMIANFVNYNSTYISRLFRQMTGENLFQYIMRMRIDKATEYLTQTNDSIQTIAEKLGFDTSQYFSSVFKKQTGLSPRDYRNRSMDGPLHS